MSPLGFGRRVVEPDPGQVATTLRPLMGLIKRQLSAEQVEAIAGALPGAVADQFRSADVAAPWPYRVLPRPFGQGRRRAG